MSANMPADFPRYEDDPNCREIYVDGAQVVNAGGLTRIEFFVMRWNADSPTRMDRRIPVARIVMAPQVVAGLAPALQAQLGPPSESGLPPPGFGRG
jgi:hypothetical protein